MIRPVRVAQLIDSLAVGGAERLQVTFAAAVRERDVELTVISLKEVEHSQIAIDLRQQGARVVSFPAGRLADLRRLVRLVRFLRDERFDVVCTHLSHANILGTLAAKAAGVPSIATLHNVVTVPDSLRFRVETGVLRWLPRHVVAVGQAVAASHGERLAGRSCAVVPNPVPLLPPLPPNERQAVRAELAGNPERPLIISIGTLTRQKAYADLLSAFAALSQTQPQTVLVIAGDGPLRSELEARIETLGIRERARLLGLRHDVPRLLGAADVFVSSSQWEGLPLAILEAMASGLPIVATRVGGVPELVSSDCGRLVPPGDVVALTAAMGALLADSGLRCALGRAAQAYVAKHHAPACWAEQWLALFPQVA